MSEPNTNPDAPKVAFVTLGCKLNFSETATISRQFTENGYQVVKQNEKADVYVINTCSVTSMAEKKSRQTINKLKKQAPDSKVVAVGCYAQLRGNEIAELPGINLVLGTNEKFKILEYLQEDSGEPLVHSCGTNELNRFDAAFSVSERTRSFLKVQDGCDYFCSYCTIPYARGKSRNDSIENILREASIIAEKGIKEIILTGVNTGDFGKTTGESFIELLRALETVEGIERFRISSIEPNLLTDEIIAFVATSDKFLPHFHIPLQAGSDNVLKLMRRKYDTSVFVDRIKAVHKKIEDCFIGIDVICGFPGETDDDFKQTYELLEGLNISYLHIFPYSDRPGTLSIKMDNKVQNSIITERTKTLQELSEKKHRMFYEANIRKDKKVLFENRAARGKMIGFTENYLKVEAPYKEELLNSIIICNLNRLENDNKFLID